MGSDRRTLASLAAMLAGVTMTAACQVPLLSSGATAKTACERDVAGLRNNSSVVDYQQTLSTDCSDYAEFTHAYNKIKHESAYAAFVVLVFCSPSSQATSPQAVYDSTLCASSRSDDPTLAKEVAAAEKPFCPVEAGNAGCGSDQASSPAGSGASPDAISTPTYVAPSDPVAAPPAPSSFTGQAVACNLWKFTVSRVTPSGDYYSVTGRLVNTSSQSLYAESFTLGINGSGDALSAYVGSTVDPGGSVPVTFDQSGGTVGGTGQLQSIDSLSSPSGGGGGC